MRLVFVILMMLLPVLAHAAPVIVVVAAIAGSLSVMQVVLLVGSMVYGMAQQKKMERKAQREAAAQRAAYNAGLKDRTINQIATEAAHTYIYGRARVGGLIIAMFASGGRDEYKHIVLVHAAHECDAIEEIYINGVALGELDANGNVTTGPYVATTTEQAPMASYSTETGEILLPHTPLVAGGYFQLYVADDEGGSGTSFYYIPIIEGNRVRALNNQTGEFFNKFSLTTKYQYTAVTPMVRVRKHLGAPDDLADASLLAEVPGKWLPTSVVRGYCYTAIRLNLNQAEFQSGLPQIEALIRGKKLFDFRTGETRWSQNNAEAIYDYLTSEICGVDAEDLPLDQFIAAANVCDEEEEWGSKYTFNGTVYSDMAQAGVLERMVQSMAGGLVATTWDIYAGKYTAPIMALDQSDIVGSVAITPGISDADLYNGVRGQYTSEETGYVSTDFEPFQNQAYVDADGRELWTNIDFGFTDSLQRVHNLARIFTEDQRNSYMLKAQFSLKAWPLKIGQRVTVSSSVFGLDDKIFRVTDKKYSPTSMVELSLKADDPTIWDAADAVTPAASPNTNLPNPFAIEKIASVTCQSGSEHLIAQDGTIISRILVAWPRATTPAVVQAGVIEIEWQMLESEVWNKSTVTGAETEVHLSPVEDGAFYNVRVRAVNLSLNLKSDWTYAALHQVVGKTGAPLDMQNLSINGSVLSWTPNRELDLKGYVFRFHYGNNLDWNSAVPLHEGVITELPFDLVTRPAGMVTIMGKCLDTSGNESLATANIITNLGDLVIANVVEVFDFHADGFPGDWEGAESSLGDLVAIETDSFYGTDSQSAFGLDNESAYASSSYSQLRYTTEEVSIASVLVGSIMTLEIEYEGVDLFIEYRLSGPGPAYGADSDSMYGPDDAPFYGNAATWVPWPGQLHATNDVYQWRITLGAGAAQARINALSVTIDAPDMVEYLANVPISAAGTVVPYTKAFSSIKTVTLTLQANASGAVTLEVDKAYNLGPVVKAYNVNHVAVSGATADIIVKGF